MTGQLILMSFGKIGEPRSALFQDLTALYAHISSRACGPKTKMIILNTPHNPVGKVFTRDELMKIADIAKELNIMVMSDEVVRFWLFWSQNGRRNNRFPKV